MPPCKDWSRLAETPMFGSKKHVPKDRDVHLYSRDGGIALVIDRPGLEDGHAARTFLNYLIRLISSRFEVLNFSEGCHGGNPSIFVAIANRDGKLVHTTSELRRRLAAQPDDSSMLT